MYHYSAVLLLGKLLFARARPTQLLQDYAISHPWIRDGKTPYFDECCQDTPRIDSDEDYLAVALYGKDPVLVFDVKTGNLVRSLAPLLNAEDCYSNNPCYASIAIDAGAIAIGVDHHRLNTVMVYSVSTGELIQTVQGPTNTRAFGRQVFIKGDYLLVSSDELDSEEKRLQVVFLFDVPSGNLIQKYSNPDCEVPGKCGDGEVSNFGYTLRALGRPLAIDGSGGRVLIGDPEVWVDDNPYVGSVYLFGVESPNALRIFPHPDPSTSNWSSIGRDVDLDGDKILVTSLGSWGEEGRAFVLQASTGALLATIRHPEDSLSSAIRGCTIVIGYPKLSPERNGTVGVYDASTYDLVQEVEGPGPGFGSRVTSGEDGRFVVSDGDLFGSGLPLGLLYGYFRDGSPSNCQEPPPTASPTSLVPTFVPTSAIPSANPSPNPTSVPKSAIPSAIPSPNPTSVPTNAIPSSIPSPNLTSVPTSAIPSANPTAVPTSAIHSANPSPNPTSVPTSAIGSANPVPAVNPTSPTMTTLPQPPSEPSVVPSPLSSSSKVNCAPNIFKRFPKRCPKSAISSTKQSDLSGKMSQRRRKKGGKMTPKAMKSRVRRRQGVNFPP